MTGLRQIAARIAQLAFVLWAVATILFPMVRLMPGNPLAADIDPTFTEEQQAALMARFGLDRPLWEQYPIYLGNLVQGDLGDSFFCRQPVFERIVELLPNTLVPTFSSPVPAHGFGIVAGAWLARIRGGRVERLAIPVVLTTRAMPEFWLGMVLRAMFGFWPGRFPAGGTRPPGATQDSLSPSIPRPTS